MYLRIFFFVQANLISQTLQANKEAETKKHKCYGDYDEFKRAEITKWVIVNGNRLAGVPESTVRSIVKAYNKEKSDKYEELAKLPKRP